MPTYKVEVKPAVTVYRRDEKGKKLFYKSGPMKGLPKTKIKTDAKYKTYIDVKTLMTYFEQADVIVIEDTGSTVGNMANATKTTQINWGKLYACAELSGAEIIVVAPSHWKRDLQLPKDKLPTIELVEKLTGRSFRTEKGRLLDGEADAYGILHWYLNYKQGKLK